MIASEHCCHPGQHAVDRGRVVFLAGLTPKHKESDTTVRRGGVTKQGSRLVRWAVIEGTVRSHGGGKLAADYRRSRNDGKNKATVAIARRVLTLVYYGVRDGEIRCLPTPHETLGHDRTRARNRHDPRNAAWSTNCLSPSVTWPERTTLPVSEGMPGSRACPRQIDEPWCGTRQPNHTPPPSLSTRPRPTTTTTRPARTR